MFKDCPLFVKLTLIFAVFFFLGLGFGLFLNQGFLFLSAGVFLFHQGLYLGGMLIPTSNLFFKSVRGTDFFKESPDFLFRFDDGPHPLYTPKLLNLLEKYDLKGIFFVTGENARLYPDLVQEIIRKGHLVGNHTFSHPYSFSLWRKKKLKEEISKTQEILKTITGVYPSFFGAPMGHKNLGLGKVLRELNLTSMSWDLASGDTRRTSPDLLKFLGPRLKKPAIIAFHDGILPWTRQDREATLTAVTVLGKKVQEERELLKT